MSDVIDDDNEWEKRHLEYEAHIDELSKSLRVCAIHGNPASINNGYESELSILADPCGCWLQAEYYDSIDECVEAWNKQPRIDAMQSTIAALRERIATLEAERWTPVVTHGFQEDMNRGMDKPRYIINFRAEGRLISMEDSEGHSMCVLLRPDYAVCRRKGSEGEVTNGE